MEFYETRDYRARATHCCSQSSLAKDAKLKKFWDDLADSWIEMEYALIADL